MNLTSTSSTKRSKSASPKITESCVSRTLSAERYNIGVPEEDPQPEHSHKHRHAIYATETTGLLLIAFLLLILTVLRYWHDIHWSLR